MTAPHTPFSEAHTTLLGEVPHGLSQALHPSILCVSCVQNSSYIISSWRLQVLNTVTTWYIKLAEHGDFHDSLNRPIESVSTCWNSSKASCFLLTALRISFLFDKTKKCYCSLWACYVWRKSDSSKRIDLHSPGQQVSTCSLSVHIITGHRPSHISPKDCLPMATQYSMLTGGVHTVCRLWVQSMSTATS